MQNLKIKNIGIAIAILLVIGVLVYVKYFSNLTDTTVNTNNTTTNNNGTITSSPVLQEVNAVDNSSSVGITAPPEPVNGRTRSISMLGPSGVFNYIVKTDGKNIKLLKKAFQPMLVNEGVVSTEDIKKVLNQYVNDSWNNGISSNGDIQIVIASSVANNPKVQAAIPDLKKTYVVTTTTSETEGAAAFKVAVAPQYQSSTVVVDMTPTIIRLSFLNGGRVQTIVARTGSKYYQNNQTDEQALAEIRQAVLQVPQANRQLVLVLWAAAEKDLRQGSNRYSNVLTYSGAERSTQSGLKLINEIKSITNSNVVIDFESSWVMGF